MPSNTLFLASAIAALKFMTPFDKPEATFGTRPGEEKRREEKRRNSNMTLDQWRNVVMTGPGAGYYDGPRCRLV